MKSSLYLILFLILTLAPRANAVPLCGLSDSNQLILVDSLNPSSIIDTLPISGLDGGEVIVAIDVNLQTGVLVGLSNQRRLFSIIHSTGVATLLQGSPLGANPLGSLATLEIDPILGKYRVLDENGLNVALSSLTGLLDGLLGLLLYPLGDVSFLHTPEIIEGAFDNLRLDEDSGILYLVDGDAGNLVQVVPGLLSKLKTIAPISGISDLNNLIGFDITKDGTAILACLLGGGSGTELRVLNLLDGTTSLLGSVTTNLLDITALPLTSAGTLVVTNTNNSGAGSLRQAIIDANLSLGRDEITFNIPGAGPHTILVSNNDLNVIGAVDILGSSQPGFSGVPLIEVAPATADAPGNLMDVTISLGGATISDLRFLGGVNMTSLLRIDTLNSVVANCEFDGLGSDVDGIVVGGVALNNSITGCTIGNCDNGLLQAVVGLSTSITDCVIRDNNIGLHFALNVGLQVLTNTATVSGCVITGNDGAGVRNSGGIVSRVLVRENSIYDNGGLGIDNFNAGVTANNNDLLDDLGVLGNLLGGSINFPVITTAEWQGGGLHLQGTVNSFTLLNVGVDFYLSPTLDPSGNGEGRTYVGTTNVSTDLLGVGTFDIVLPVTPKAVPQYLSATCNTNGMHLIVAIPLGAGTSEFSSAVLVPALNPDPGLALDWNRSGMDSGPEYTIEPGSIDDVDLEESAGSLDVIVRASTGRLRNAGFIADTGMTTADVGPDNFIRGKFYIHTTNPENAPLNTIPNFRVRLQNEGTLLSAYYFDPAQTGIGGTENEPYYDSTNNPTAEAAVSPSIRPSYDPMKPSLYRVDFDPIEVPAAANTKILALFESMAVANPAAGTLSMTAFEIGVYPKPDKPTKIFGWSNVPSLAALNVEGGTKGTNSGMFNVENQFRPGRRQALDTMGEVPANTLGHVTDTGTAGVVLDTIGVPDDRIGVALWDVFSTTPDAAPRVEPNKMYQGRFLLSSDMPTSSDGNTVMQGDVYLSLKSGFGATNARTEIIGTNQFVAPIQPAADIASQILPGLGNQINDPAPAGVVPAGEVGAWYNVLMSSPLDSDIRRHANGDLGVFGKAPGPRSTSQSVRDIGANVSVLQLARQLELSPNNFYQFATPNQAEVRVLAVEIFSFDQIDDGGYIF